MKRSVVGAMVVCLSAVSGFAAGSVEWKKVDNWTVFMDPTMGNACYVAAVYEGGTILRVGFDFAGSVRQIYLALGNDNWKSLEAGKDYPVQIQFDNEVEWAATATGRKNNDATWLYVTTTDTGFLEEFSRKLGMRTTFRGTEIARLQLKGSSRAITEMLSCQSAVNEMMGARNEQAAPPSQDPFAPTPEVKSATDPFDL
ncbi:hypothetical protein LH464_17230 [Neorhizobium sp. T786]|uniref:hypothetical protein n=1 Tax=Pseudorhizobium xiangyangii TaxID=2883104 RepID=UPI001CFFB282|nr:hypothetical protein [Neorhizobium xiangyangii]MCB5204211.1 hypothetical protein [Neorhizobium xiangyangii]